jgi:hypothetical protein
MPLTNEAPYKACSGFTHVAAHRIAQPPKATFVTRLQPSRLPSQAARQLPDLSTILRVESSSTGVSRLRGALPETDPCSTQKRAAFICCPQRANALCHLCINALHGIALGSAARDR